MIGTMLQTKEWVVGTWFYNCVFVFVTNIKKYKKDPQNFIDFNIKKPRIGSVKKKDEYFFL